MLTHTSQNAKVLYGCLTLPEHLEKSLCFSLSLITKYLICGVSILFCTEKEILVHRGICYSSWDISSQCHQQARQREHIIVLSVELCVSLVCVMYAYST